LLKHFNADTIYLYYFKLRWEHNTVLIILDEFKLNKENVLIVFETKNLKFIYKY
jgi:hypothetical protein